MGATNGIASLDKGRVGRCAELTLIADRHSIYFILPLQQSAGMDCPSGTEEPVRGTCDAFIEIGLSSQVPNSATPSTFQLECAVLVLPNPATVVPPPRVTESPHHRGDTSLHSSIRTTVLRI